MPLETRWPWAVRSLELQPSAAHCHGWAGYCGSAASGYHCRWSTQTGKTRVPTSNEGLCCHLAKWTWSYPEDPWQQANCPKAVFFGMVSARPWSWVAPDATSKTLSCISAVEPPQRAVCGAHHSNVTERFCGWLFLCFAFFFLKVETAKNCKNEFLSR